MSNLDLRRNPKQTSTSMKKSQGSTERKVLPQANRSATMQSPNSNFRRMIIVENIRPRPGDRSIGRTIVTRSSNLSRHPSNKSSHTLPRIKPSVSTTNKEQAIEPQNQKEETVKPPIIAAPIEIKPEEQAQLPLPPSSVLRRRFSLNGTTTESELGTIRSNRDSLNGTMTVELKGFLTHYRQKVKTAETQAQPQTESEINDTLATLDLLHKIRHGPTSVPIGPMPLSQQACRFELPFDLKLLEALTPLDYLARYCRLSSRRQYQFKRIFNKYRNRNYQVDSSDLYASLRDLHKENLTRATYDELCQLTDIDQQSCQFPFETFVGVLALAERLLCNAFLLRSDYDMALLTKDPIERCDFDSLKRKLDGLKVSEKMKRLLNTI